MSDESKSTEESAPADDSGKPSKADAETPAAEKDAKRADRRQSRKEASAKVKKGTDAIRNRIASVVWLVAVVCALFLAIGALLVALDAANRDNAIVSFVLEGADRLDWLFSRENGVFKSQDANAESAQTKNALVNWGLAAIVYLIVGKILDRIIRP